MSAPTRHVHTVSLAVTHYIGTWYHAVMQSLDNDRQPVQRLIISSITLNSLTKEEINEYRNQGGTGIADKACKDYSDLTQQSKYKSVSRSADLPWTLHLSQPEPLP